MTEDHSLYKLTPEARAEQEARQAAVRDGFETLLRDLGHPRESGIGWGDPKPMTRASREDAAARITRDFQ